jgi:hypothetical protein
MPGNVDEILAHAICPGTLFGDDYERFLIHRAERLEAAAEAVLR